MNLNIEDIEKNLNNLLSDNKSNPDDPDINHHIGILYGQKGEYDLSATHLQKAIIKAKMSKEATKKCLSELKKLKNMSPMSAEATVVRNYLDV